LEIHELYIRLTDKAKTDKKAVNSLLVVTTQYFPCDSFSALEALTDPTEEAPAQATTTTAASPLSTSIKTTGSNTESMGILIIKNVELTGVQSNADMNLVGENIFLVMDCLGKEQESIKKVNKAAPSSVTWLESFYFVVTKTSQTMYRFRVFHKASSLRAVGKAVTGALGALSGGSGAAQGKLLGVIEFSIPNLIKSRGTLEIVGQSFSSEYAHGEISCSLEYIENRPAARASEDPRGFYGATTE
jgi:hypothetical protein